MDPILVVLVVMMGLWFVCFLVSLRGLRAPRPTREDYVRARVEELACEQAVENAKKLQFKRGSLSAQAEAETVLLECEMELRRARQRAHDVGVRAGVIEEISW